MTPHSDTYLFFHNIYLLCAGHTVRNRNISERQMELNLRLLAYLDEKLRLAVKNGDI